jgi:hypothetical protein
LKSLFSRTAQKTAVRTGAASKATAADAKAAAPASPRPAAHGTRDGNRSADSAPARGFSRPNPPPPVRNYGPPAARMRGFDRAHSAQLRIKRYTRAR